MNCPTCKAGGNLVNIQKCMDCGKLFCWRCAGRSAYGPAKCPECGGENTADFRDGYAGQQGGGDPPPHW